MLKTKEKAQKLKDELTQYRDDVEDYYNSLLYQSWMLISDRNNLDNKTKWTWNSKFSITPDSSQIEKFCFCFSGRTKNFEG